MTTGPMIYSKEYIVQRAKELRAWNIANQISIQDELDSLNECLIEVYNTGCNNSSGDIELQCDIIQSFAEHLIKSEETINA